MTTEVFPCCERFRLHAVPEVLLHMVAKDGFTQSARAAVNQHRQLLLAQTERLECLRFQHFLDPLQFGEVITTADGPERILGEWWKSESEIELTRDYFRVETEEGARFWLFRDGTANDGRWWLHGIGDA